MNVKGVYEADARCKNRGAVQEEVLGGQVKVETFSRCETSVHLQPRGRGIVLSFYTIGLERRRLVGGKIDTHLHLPLTITLVVQHFHHYNKKCSCMRHLL